MKFSQVEPNNMLLSFVVYILPLIWNVEQSYAVNILETATETLNVNITHKKSSTSSISIEWAINIPETIDEYHIRYRKDDSAAVTYSPALEWNSTSYEIKHLITNSLYNICIVATVLGNGSKSYEKACVDLKTIPLIRNDSLIALLATIAYIVLTILFGYFIWKKRKAEHDDQKLQAALDKASVGSSEKLEKEDANQRNFLLPPGQRPERLSIEDPDIPYITPPVSEIHDDSASELTVDYRENYN